MNETLHNARYIRMMFLIIKLKQWLTIEHSSVHRSRQAQYIITLYSVRPRGWTNNCPG